MANNSDHTKPFNNINNYLPEVYRSDVNRSAFDVAFNRHLTKDDTSRVAGFIGEGNPDALVDRQIKEATPHRQAYQLSTTMYSKVGTVDSALSFKAFLAQLELMGVDINRLPKWGNTTQFNWAPPINIDMLVNYQDYFWKPDVPSESAQYFTIENRCNKANSKVQSYQNVLLQRGEAFPVIRINYATNEFVVAGKSDDLFVAAFEFYTKNATNVNLQNKFWTVNESTYDFAANETTINVIEPIAIISDTPPTATYIGQWWYNTISNSLTEWNGSAWVPSVQAQAVTVSLAEQLLVYQAQANCVCSQDFGWDMAAWDDNQVGTTPWSDTWFATITFNTSTQWIAANGAPTVGSTWYNPIADTLNSYDGTDWVSSIASFSSVIDRFTGNARWDYTAGCDAQVLNQWSEQNRWIHKSQVQSYSDVRRAQVPILEYSSYVELNQWSKVNYVWKYRANTDDQFAVVEGNPVRFELEPIKGYIAQNSGGSWFLYLFADDKTINRDIDYTKTFVPGYRFRIQDDTLVSQVYTVSSSEYREIVSADPTAVKNVTGTGYMVTVVRIAETTFTSATTGGGAQNVRIEPLQTSRGDTWRGYHAHWVLDEAASTTSAAANQPLDLYLRESLETSTPPILVSTLPIHFDTGGAFVPQVSSITVGKAHQQLVVDIPGVTRVDLIDQFRFNPANSTVYATPNSNELRVYVNDVRQYANYTEVIGTGSPNYTLVGQTVYTNQTIEYVQAVVFDQPLNLLDVVRIEVGPAAMSDMGMYSIPVRTEEDEAAFTLAAVNGLQPVYRTLTTYQKLDQAKTLANQYPLFNVYNLVSSEVIAGSHLFGFREDSTASVNGAVQRRIVTSADGREFEFEQFLLDRDDNLLYGYRNTNLPTTYWYSPLLNTVKYWDGRGWQDDVVMTLSTGARVLRRPVIADLPPSNLLNIDQALWFNTTNNQLFRRNVSTSSWVSVANVVINGSDPSLRTVWRHGDVNGYVPQYVDKGRNPVAVGDPDGDWGVVDQWFYNPEHHNRKTVKFSQIVTHFRTILEAQPRIPGLLGGGIYTLTQNDYDYGVGGTIKEHNDSFDTLISAVNVTNVTPLGVIDFATQEYASGLLFIRDLFNKMTIELFSDYSRASLSDFAGYIDDLIIARYENNDFTAQIYGDTLAYDPQTGKGVRNWITTIPMMGLGPKYRPHLNQLNGLIQLFHHDGHRSAVFYSTAEQDRYSRIICNMVDPRGGLFGRISTATPPATDGEFVAGYGHTMRPGMYWYRVSGGTRKLYRFSAYDIAPTAPSFYDINGVEIADGTTYYNISSQSTFEKVGLSWQEITMPGEADISPLWHEIDFSLLLGKVLLELETRLYDVTPTLPLSFDYDSLTPDTNEQDVYDQLQRSRFDSYVASNNISSPFANTQYSATNAFTWNYSASLPAVPPRIVVPSPPLVGAWQALYTAWYNTPYPHAEPWKLQGFHDKPVWWDEEYKDPTGARRWIYTHATTTGMWENIRIGHVPAGRTYPNGAVSTGDSGVDGQSLPTYDYFSVNISDGVIAGGYAPDSLLPPFYDNSAIAVSLPTVRSLFTNYNAEINAPDADYAYGDLGPVEWQWSVSGQHPYDLPAVAFLMQPVRFLHYAFGPQYTLVDELQVETTVQQVYSHEDVLFHGDVFNVTESYSARGLNQWYVNYNRYSGYDTNGEFRQLWAGWDPRLTYQYGGIVDTSTFEIGTKYFDIINQDYNIILANNGVFRDLWVDAFEVSLINVPPALIQYNNQAQWKMEIDSLAAIERSIEYYGVKQYPFSADPATDICSAFTFPILRANAPAGRFSVDGDQTGVFTPGLLFTVSNSTANDGIYTVQSSVFETSTNRTRINVVETITATISDGLISVSGFSLPWNTGDEIVLSSTKFLPAPLQPNTPYYIIKLTNQTFKLAESPNDALSNVAINLTSRGEGTLHVAQLDSSFVVFGGAGNTTDVWYHYAIDKSDIRTFTPPYTILGMQTLINIIDGYAALQKDRGVMYGTAESSDFDPETGRLINWALETERFIDWAYGLRQARISFADSYPVTANATTDELTFTGATPMWLSGTAVAVSSTGTLPAPLLANTEYYVVNTGTGVFKLSISANANDTSALIDLTSSGSGMISVGLFEKNRAYPRFEINPSRNNTWIETPLGVLSDVVSGPYTDIRVQQTIFDQYSRPIGSDKLTVYREDKRSHIAIRPELKNDVDPIYDNDPYNYIHMGGGHFFVEGYEHFLIFNDYTVGGSLIYDQFLGLYTKKFSVDYFEKQDYTLRPTLGGYYLLDGKFNRNIEGAASDMQNYYDTLALSETAGVAKRARSILGYRGRQSFLDLLNINSKSQFLFYKGMIQTKGSVNSVKAFINSRRFVDARVDEFWAWKIAEYGDSRMRVYPEIKLFSSDGALDDVRLEFLGDSELATDIDIVEAVNKGFQLVSFKDDKRWNIFPEQKQLIQSPLFLNTEVSSLTLVHCGPTYPHPGTETTITRWFDTQTQQLFEYNPATRAWDVNVTANNITVQTVNVGSPAVATECVYYRLDTPCDDVRVLRRTLTQQTFNIVSCTAPGTIVIGGDRTADLTVNVPFIVSATTSNDGAYTPTSVVFNGTNTVVTVAGGIVSQGVGGFVITQDFSNYTTEFYNPGSGEREYTKIDSEVVRFDLTGFADVIMIFTINPAKTQLSPAKLIDTKAQAVVQQLPMWDPARGHHSHIAAHNVDLFYSGDPARYEFTPNPNDASQNFWNQAEVGKVWLDTSYLGYLPYFDDKVYPDVNERLYNWGKLAPWGSVRVYQWVRSVVPPSEWDALVTSQVNDGSIPQNQKATGTPRRAVFKRVRSGTTVTASASTNRITMSPLTVSDGDQVLFTTTDTLPTGITAGVKYIVDVFNTTQFYLIDPDTEEQVDLVDAGTGTLTLVPAFVASDWNNQSLIVDRVTAPFAVRLSRELAGIPASTAITWGSVSLSNNRLVWNPKDPTVWVTGTGVGSDQVDVYVNGRLLDTGLSIVANTPTRFYVTLSSAYTPSEYDIIDIVRPVHDVTPSEAEFDPDVEDDGTQMIQWKEDYEYSSNTLTVGGTTTGLTPTTYYYFWVENATVRDESEQSNLSVFEIAQQIETIPTPYFIVQRPKDDPYLVEKYGYGMVEYGSVFSLGSLREQDYQVPVLYRQAVIRKVASYLNDDDRYVVRFTRDMTLRDDIQDNGRQMNLKNRHQEWFMFRRNQTNTIPQELWDRLTEALMGYTMADSTIRVPALERELYDATYGTDTRFGLGSDQAFVDRQLGLSTVVAYLQDPTKDFSPTDIDAFFANNSFDTPENIRAAMSTIYTTFAAEHVNAIWFETLLDALSTRAKYRELMKTSWIALHGIRVLEVGGLFDD